MTILDASRLGAAAMLLSLDRVLSFYPDIGLGASDPAVDINFQKAVRRAIENNRAAFVANPDFVPDLNASLVSALRDGVGDRGIVLFWDWHANVFVHRAEDFIYHQNWFQFFNRLQGIPARWLQVALPDKIRVDAQQNFSRVKDISDLKARQRQLEALPLSAWDTKMFVIHRLYAEGREPFDWIRETVYKRRFMAFLHWLKNQLDDQARDSFIVSAGELKRKIPSFDGSPDFPALFEDIDQVC